MKVLDNEHIENCLRWLAYPQGTSEDILNEKRNQILESGVLNEALRLIVKAGLLRYRDKDGKEVERLAVRHFEDRDAYVLEGAVLPF